jgi:hypothetical protein
MNTALPRRELPAARAFGGTGAHADCAAPDAPMSADLVPIDRSLAEQATPQPDRYGPTPTLVAGATDVTEGDRGV